MPYRYNGIEVDTLEELLKLMRAAPAYPTYTSPYTHPTIDIRMPEIPCAHMSCTLCRGTGQRLDGLGMCIHMLVCNCPRCTITCNTSVCK